MRKTFGYKSITHLIYGLLMLMPFVFIGAKTCYTILNKNAYQSYSNYNADNKQYSALTQWNELTSGTTYMLISNNDNSNVVTSNSPRFMVNNLQVIVSNVAQTTNELIETADSFALWRTNNVTYIRFYNEGTSLTTSGFNNLSIQFTFEYVNNYGFDTTNDIDKYTGGLVYKSHLINTTNTLDNAFSYSINQIIDNNNVGLIDFTGWFRGLALSDNAINNTFINFINWYFNYAIIVSAVNILFLCLLWFVNFARKLLERGMNYDW